MGEMLIKVLSKKGTSNIDASRMYVGECNRHVDIWLLGYFIYRVNEHFRTQISLILFYQSTTWSATATPSS